MFKLSRCVAAFALVAAVAAPLPALAQSGVSINIGQPGFYGRIDIGGNLPPPALIYPEPVVIQPPPYRVQRAPIYLRVPPQQARNWRRYCARYDACGQPVYFVQDRWYNDVYVPRHRMGPPAGYRPGYGPPPHYRDREDDGRRGRRDDPGRWERDQDHRGRGYGGDR